MNGQATRRVSWPLIGWLIAAAVLVTVAAANAHLVYVAVATHPDCVAHLKEAGTREGGFRAAKSDC
ncbi:hypothetical protein ILT44_24685 [Microvirga sp. BT689]|uniref:hypothetical protein n=1 Tax=Microvirga arvi TaxID=2778731 RepID=UPI0019523D73|nr:hypothetical protein [Microvirga arvi]MBM6583403.1 hypothetical protein [Microvirga arvi]